MFYQKLIFDFDVDEVTKGHLREIFKDSVRFAEKHLEEMQGGKIPKIFEAKPKVVQYDQVLGES